MTTVYFTVGRLRLISSDFFFLSQNSHCLYSISPRKDALTATTFPPRTLAAATVGNGMTALHLAPLFLSYLHSDAITACCYSSLRPPRCLPLKWRPCYAVQAFPPSAGSISQSATRRDICLNSRGNEDKTSARTVGSWGLADMRLGRSGSDLRQEERQSQNGNMTVHTVINRGCYTWPRLFFGMWQRSQTRSFRDIAAISYQTWGETLRGTVGWGPVCQPERAESYDRHLVTLPINPRPKTVVGDRTPARPIPFEGVPCIFRATSMSLRVQYP
ncbi:hypothetical protein BDP81DRAFT_86259 [Colletotrichum phormii]|uniref:Uncharacterized protein n=1 Tax=Colletotrichum phormii TaxID=359342 RepID=A0AAJ0A2A7_9PEZI|nr:uncharacterized protein BDP81DRAFT_86259 [Colletotrichum phormii]KAK1654638.1 hypothetical protein BDP81DRAFT_86259 [Colletotrichum phormii]